MTGCVPAVPSGTLLSQDQTMFCILTRETADASFIPGPAHSSWCQEAYVFLIPADQPESTISGHLGLPTSP